MYSNVYCLDAYSSTSTEHECWILRRLYIVGLSKLEMANGTESLPRKKPAGAMKLNNKNGIFKKCDIVLNEQNSKQIGSVV